MTMPVKAASTTCILAPQSLHRRSLTIYCIRGINEFRARHVSNFRTSRSDDNTGACCNGNEICKAAAALWHPVSFDHVPLAPAAPREITKDDQDRSPSGATGNLIRASKQPRIGRCSFPMIDFLRLLACALTRLFRSRARLEAEILVLRHQLNVLRRKAPKRGAFRSIDRLVFAGLYRLAPGVLDALKIIKPETVIRWHRVGFRAYWRWKSRARGGRPKTPLEIRQLIRDMSIANPLWGAPRVHGELLMLGIDVGQTTVAKYMVRPRQPPSQGWKTFLRNHTDGIASMDLFVVPTISFRLLYGLLIFQHRRRVLRMARCNRASDCRMDRSPAHRGIRLGEDTTIHHSRSRWGLWRRLDPAASCDGHPGSADRASITMAKWTYGEAHRFDPTGLP